MNYDIYRRVRLCLDTFDTDGVRFFLRNHAESIPFKAEVLARYKAQVALNQMPDVVKLYTIQKSGTNYFRLLLANYVYALREPTGHIHYRQMMRFIFPPDPTHFLRLDRISEDAPLPGQWMKEWGYEHFFYRHGAYGTDEAAAPMILLYRNPLDFIVSWYHYRYANRGSAEFRSISESVPSAIKKYMKAYGAWRSLPTNPDEPNGGRLWVTYEDLVTDPTTQMRRVLDYLAIPIEGNELDRAVEASSIGKVRQFETEQGPIHGAKGQFFTRSGKIGQWQSELTSDDVDFVRQYIADAGHSLDDFQTTE